MQQQKRSIVPAVAAVLVATFAVTLHAGGPAHAADDCIATPNASAPQGSHWYYHVDRETHRTCWYLGAQGQKVHRAAAKIATLDESTAPQAGEVAADHAAPPARIQPSVPQAPPLTVRADAASTAAQAIAPSSSQGAAPTVRWPDPPRAAVSPEQEGVGAASAQPMPQAAMVDASDADQPDAAPASGPVGGSNTAHATAMFMRVFLLIGGALAAAGILQQAIFKGVFARRRIHVERDRADRPWRDARAALPPMFVATRPGDRMRAPIERVDPQVVEDAMQQILRSIERRAA